MTIGLHTAELNFEFLREIGQEGRNSQVYAAHDKQLDKEIAVKKIRKDSIEHVDDYYEESKKLNTSYHSNIVNVMYGCSDIDYIYIAMHFYENGSLKSLIKDRFLTVREVIRYSIQFLSGLHHIHSKGLIHCDIKPDNILISDSDEALLSDFGLAKFMDESGYVNQAGVYSKQAPPEVLVSHDKTIHYDIYQSGLTMYRLLNGEDHFNNQLEKFTTMEDYKEAIRTGAFPDRHSYLPHIPTKMQKIVNKSLNIEIEDRHCNVLELINELSNVADGIDWIYEPDELTRKWTKSITNPVIETILSTDKDGLYSIVTTKTNGSSSPKKVTAHCNTQLSDYKSELKRVFKL
ncbi:serine/threonine protein kinase [Psychrobacter cryohalolentis]|uniref:serine/threonine-protein kinase n=1 Tax=Psychrobacter sp. D2 TaxID=2759702 RepID=UPI0015E5BC34|nr:serine/threonine-protein kinase [Psychrobacter sp. D2]MBA2058786.1 serine/threonine protein kinase [Psychrobacter sp. D2]